MNTLLSTVQEQAINSNSQRVCVIATAGSGKTMVLTKRIANLIITEQVEQSRILAITFTNKAANEMKTRLELLLSNKGIDKLSVTVTTFDSFAKHLVEQYIGHTISACEIKDGNSDADTYTFDEIRSLSLNALEDTDFKDMIGSLYDHILIDEFQDITSEMFTLISSLLTDHNALFAVGDDDQNIYRFNGSEAIYITHFKSFFPGSSIYVLDQNYRSSRNIVNLMNSLISNNKERYPKVITTRNPEGSLPVYHHFRTKEQEDSYIIGQIKSLLNSGHNPNEIMILYRFTRHVDIMRNMLAENKISINVLTIHQAKGLECKVVFLPALNDGVLPVTENRSNSIEDERRLLFVGVSRAQEKLFLSSFTTERIKGHNDIYKPTRYIDEIKSCIMTPKYKLKPINPNQLKSCRQYYYMASNHKITFICKNDNRYCFGNKNNELLMLTQQEVSKWVRETMQVNDAHPFLASTIKRAI